MDEIQQKTLTLGEGVNAREVHQIVVEADPSVWVRIDEVLDALAGEGGQDGAPYARLTMVEDLVDKLKRRQGDNAPSDG